MSKHSGLIVGALAGILSVAAAPAAALTVEQIVEQANQVAYYQGADGRSQVEMTITDSQGRERKRAFTIVRLNSQTGAAQKFFVHFRAPADVRDMTYMVWKQTTGDDDRWLYLPALDLVRRIAASDKRSSFVGSHFVYEDISGRSLALDRHELLSEDEEYYTVRNTPHDSAAVEFSYFDVRIRKDNFLPVRADYYDAQNVVIKTVEALAVEDIDGFPTVMISRAADVLTGGYTVMNFSGVRYNLGLTDDLFTERYLRRPPRRLLE